MDCRWTAVEKERVARHFGASLTLCEPGDTLAPDIATEIVDGDWLAKVERLPATHAFPSGGDTPLLLVALLRHHRAPQGPVDCAQTLFPALHDALDQSRFERAAPFHVGDTTLFRRRPHVCDVGIVQRRNGHYASAALSAARSDRRGRGDQRDQSVSGADNIAALAGAERCRSCSAATARSADFERRPALSPGAARHQTTAVRQFL